MSYKIVCTGNPNKNTIASAIRDKFPFCDFLHLTNGYDLRLWDDERKQIFTNKIKDYIAKINSVSKAPQLKYPDFSVPYNFDDNYHLNNYICDNYNHDYQLIII